MKTPHQLASCFREVILNGTWVANTNVKAQLSGTDWKTVTTPINDLNTIAVLAQHIHYYINGINQVFKGGPLAIKDKYSFDFPPITSQEQWETFLQRFWNDAETFAKQVEQLTDKQLDSNFTNPNYGSYHRNIDGMIEHSYYHLGQIVLIKKLISA
ncbi:DinB family protein [Flavobacterium lacus]|uniref:Damage-inducible protein DinB n=1 Tax=Flavobacterium lacus TaxID=1353778 RepID=A0A328X6G8_9FLAO|nr:DinB family protein [Flavobacterium lacus]RAR50928.1 hypothetical protein B0I10_10199 [Flavobacterium lacus]